MSDNTETGYTRAQLADAVDEAHAALHEADAVYPPSHAEGQPGTPEFLLCEAIGRAHETLHRVGAGLPRVGCATPKPEAQAILADLIASRRRELPCGHTLADLIGGTEADGRPCITVCGACLGERQPEVMQWNRLRRAWKASGMALGKLVDEAAFLYSGASGGARTVSDEALVDMCERYVREHPTQAKTGT